MDLNENYLLRKKSEYVVHLLKKSGYSFKLLGGRRGVSDVLDPEGNPYTSFWESTISINTSNIKDFIPFSELTNEISVGWVQSTMGAETVAFWEETVAYSIENLINPVSIPLIIGE